MINIFWNSQNVSYYKFGDRSLIKYLTIMIARYNKYKMNEDGEVDRLFVTISSLFIYLLINDVS
jgi:hypothetical protein